MKKSITTEELTHFLPEDEVLKIYKVAGFDAVDYSYDYHAYKGSVYDHSDYVNYAKKIRKTADEIGIELRQMHAPLYHHRIDLPYTAKDLEEEKFLKDMTIKGFEVASILGCKYMVMHPRKMFYYDTKEAHKYARDYNIKMYKEYEDLAKKYNVKIALENMFSFNSETHKLMDTVFRTGEEIVSYLEELNSKWFVACLDTGHANMNGINPSYMAKVLGNYLEVIHVHDNYGDVDSHHICGMGNIDWNTFVKTLREISYKGSFSLETFAMCENHNVDDAKNYINTANKVISDLLK